MGWDVGRDVWLGFLLDCEVQAEIASLFVEVCLEVVLDEIRRAAPDQCLEQWNRTRK